MKQHCLGINMQGPFPNGLIGPIGDRALHNDGIKNLLDVKLLDAGRYAAVTSGQGERSRQSTADSRKQQGSLLRMEFLDASADIRDLLVG